MAVSAKAKRTLIEPIYLPSFEIEVSAHTLSRALHPDVLLLSPIFTNSKCVAKSPVMPEMAPPIKDEKGDEQEGDHQVQHDSNIHNMGIHAQIRTTGGIRESDGANPRAAVEATQLAVEVQSLCVVAAFQKSAADLISYSAAATAEKDRLLMRFLHFGQVLRNMLMERGYWCDFVDPCSGFLMNSPSGGSPLNDLDLLSCLLPYSTTRVGTCWVMSHPRWGSATYPATILTDSPHQVLADCIRSLSD